MDRKRLVILISGSGSNLQAFIDAVNTGNLDADIVSVVSNETDAFGLQRATRSGIATAVLSHRDYSSREDYDHALLDEVTRHAPDLVILAGFMRILTPVFVTPLYGKLMNIHPSLLPKYTGLHTHQRALDAGDAEAGVTVHFVSAELDSGPIIVQAAVPVLPDDSVSTLANRVLEKEHIIYPLAARWFCEGRLRCDNELAWLDDQALPPSGRRYPCQD